MENKAKETCPVSLSTEEMETVSGGAGWGDIEKEIERVRNEISRDWQKYIPGPEDIEFWKNYFANKKDPEFWKKYIPDTDWSKYLDLIPDWK